MEDAEIASIVVGHTIHIGGLVAVGLDDQEDYLLTVTHPGRGVFSTKTWEKIARDYQLAYPTDGLAIGIGPIDGKKISVSELDSDHPIEVTSKSGRFHLYCESSVIEITDKSG